MGSTEEKIWRYHSTAGVLHGAPCSRLASIVHRQVRSKKQHWGEQVSHHVVPGGTSIEY
jgi:hypothetical protein